MLSYAKPAPETVNQVQTQTFTDNTSAETKIQTSAERAVECKTTSPLKIASISRISSPVGSKDEGEEERKESSSFSSVLGVDISASNITDQAQGKEEERGCESERNEKELREEEQYFEGEEKKMECDTASGPTSEMRLRRVQYFERLKKENSNEASSS